MSIFANLIGMEFIMQNIIIDEEFRIYLPVLDKVTYELVTGCYKLKRLL